MKKLILPVLVLIAGTAVGGGAAFGTSMLVEPATADPEKTAEEGGETSFVPVEKITAPLVMEDGRLSGYVSFDIQLKVAADEVEFVTERVPVLLHAINMRTYRTPLAAGPDGMLPEIEAFRAVVMDAAPEAFGPDVVKMTAVTQAVPI